MYLGSRIWPAAVAFGRLGLWDIVPAELDYVHPIAMNPANGRLSTVEIKNWRIQKQIGG